MFLDASVCIKEGIGTWHTWLTSSIHPPPPQAPRTEKKERRRRREKLDPFLLHTKKRNKSLSVLVCVSTCTSTKSTNEIEMYIRELGNAPWKQSFANLESLETWLKPKRPNEWFFLTSQNAIAFLDRYQSEELRKSCSPGKKNLVIWRKSWCTSLRMLHENGKNWQSGNFPRDFPNSVVFSDVAWFVLYSPFPLSCCFKQEREETTSEMPAWLKGFSRGNPSISLIFFPFYSNHLLHPTNSTNTFGNLLFLSYLYGILKNTFFILFSDVTCKNGRKK